MFLLKLLLNIDWCKNKNISNVRKVKEMLIFVEKCLSYCKVLCCKVRYIKLQSSFSNRMLHCMCCIVSFTLLTAVIIIALAADMPLNNILTK